VREKTSSNSSIENPPKLLEPTPRRYLTNIGVPFGTRSKRSMTSWLTMRTQPDETDLPIDHHSGEPWTR
jgi:hypothetical protein